MIVEIHSERLIARSPVTYTNSHTVGGRRQDHRERERERTNEYFINEGNGISTILSFIQPSRARERDVMNWITFNYACSTHEGVHYRSKHVTQVQQQRPKSPTVTLTWHACKYKVHKLHQRYILKLRVT